MGVDQGRAPSQPAITNCITGRPVAVHQVGAVALDDEQIGEARYELGDTSTRGVDLDGDRDRVSVVLDEKNHGELEITCGIEGLPELTLGRGSLTRTYQDDLILLEAFDPGLQLGDERYPVSHLCRADGLQELRARGGRHRHEVEVRIRKVGRHLPAGAVRVGGGPDRAEKVVQGGLPQGQRQRSISVVRVEPVVPAPQVGGHRHLRRLVPGCRDLKEGLVLAF